MITVMTTADRKEVLELIGRTLLEKRLVACFQISGPITSVYWWKGALEETVEWKGTMKTRDELYYEVERELKALHPYDVPEIVAVKTAEALSDYAEWVCKETGG